MYFLPEDIQYLIWKRYFSDNVLDQLNCFVIHSFYDNEGGICIEWYAY